jgi:hypothetical protein
MFIMRHCNSTWCFLNLTHSVVIALLAMHLTVLHIFRQCHLTCCNSWLLHFPTLPPNVVSAFSYSSYVPLKLRGFQHNRSNTNHIFRIRQILEKKLDCNEAVHQLFIDFEKAYDSVRREALYNFLIEFGIPKKRVSLIKMCLTEMYSRVQVGKNLSEMFPIRNVLK